MNTSRSRSNGNSRARRWMRRGHRWVGLSLVVFVLLLAVTGIALNHSVGFKLDQHYVGWPWLLDAYGMEEPAPYVGMVVLGPMVVVADDYRVHLLLESGELVESMDLAATIPGVIERIGRVGDRVVLQSGEALFRADEEVSRFAAWNADASSDIAWSATVSPDTPGLEALEAAWRGRGVSVERVLLDLHSGRILGKAGPLLMDFVAVLLIVLGLSGLVLSKVRNRRR